MNDQHSRRPQGRANPPAQIAAQSRCDFAGLGDIPREALLSLPEVMRLTTLRQSAIYARMSAGTFPASRQVGLRKVAWPAGEVLDWIANLPKRVPGGKLAASMRPSEAGAAAQSGEDAGSQGARSPSSSRTRPRRTTAA